MNISVIICSHNPRPDYLARVLDALKAQTLPKEQWELLLVDNASREPLAAAWNLSWHPNARHLREEKTGLTHARLCGIAAAQGDLLVFVDDDNLLYPNYLETVLIIAAEHPRLGAWGGSCIPEFEVEPAAELRPWLGGLVIEKLHIAVWAKLPMWTEAGPAGAGLVLRRQQALHYRNLVLNDPLRQKLGRSGKMLGAGEDGDMGLCGFELGFGTGRFPELELTHLIPARRLSLEYLEGIHAGFGFGQVMLKAIHTPNSLPTFGRAAWLRDCLKTVAMFLSGKSRVERRLDSANRKGQQKAHRELVQSGFYQRKSN
jgi:glycosyltransferase involved in cell wall biosynthesis